MLLQQCPALALSHTAPDAELDLVVQGIRGAFLHNRAVPADHGGLALGGAADKEFVGVSRPAQRLRNPAESLVGITLTYRDTAYRREVGPSASRTIS